MNYKEMCNEDKLAAIMETRFGRGELDMVGQYVEALQNNYRAVIEEFESFGDLPQKMAENKAHFARAFSAFGFTGVTVNEHGWPEREAFFDCETFNFGCGLKGNIGSNSVTIGKGPNGKWTYGVSFWASKSGCCSGLSVFGDPYDSRRECLRHGLEKLIAWHTKENDRKTAPVIREAKDMLDTIMGRKSVQLSLF